MNCTIGNLRILLIAGDIDKEKWDQHFATVPETLIPSCRDCLDWKNGTCREEGDPVECFLYGTHSRPEGMLFDKTTR